MSCSIVPAQAQTGYLTYPAGITPTGIAAADLNGDGRPDVVIANLGSNSLTTLLNDGKGGFTTLPGFILGVVGSPSVSLFPNAIVTADLNGDRKTDLVLISANAVGVVVLLGNGDGTFQSPLPVSGCPKATGALIADFNGDGIPDLALTCLNGGFLIPTGADLLILTGKGDGTFGNATSYSLGFTPWAIVTTGDFNTDGKPDIAVATGGTLTVFLNDGKANFKTVYSAKQPWNFAPGIAAGDFNRDGLPDLAVTGLPGAGGSAPGLIAILLGRGDGTFLAAPVLTTAGVGPIVAMDLNGDGHLDLAEGLSSLTFFAGNGDGTFTVGLPFGGSGSTGNLALADFTGAGVIGFAGTNDLRMPDATPIAGTAVILPRAIWPSLTFANLSAAGLGLGPLAPGSIATALGRNLAAQSTPANGTPPLSLAGTSVSITDAAGASRKAQLYYVSPGQVNYVVPPETAQGLATVSIMAGDIVTASGQIDVAPVAPTLFTVNPDNLAAANVLRVSQNGDRTFEPIYKINPDGSIAARPVDFGSETDTVYLILYGTGVRNLRSSGAVSATVSGMFNLAITYAGPQGTLTGLDQINLLLPRTLISLAAHTAVLRLVVDGANSNQITLLVQ